MAGGGRPDAQVGSEGGGELVHAGVTLVDIPGQRLQADRVERRVPARFMGRRRGGRGMSGRLEQHFDDRVLVGQLAGQELVEHHAQAVNVARRPDALRLAAELLRAHVGQRAHHRAGVGHPLRLGVEYKGDAEVGHDRLAARGDDDVRGLQVAVDDTQAMRGGHRQRDRPDQLAAARGAGGGHLDKGFPAM